MSSQQVVPFNTISQNNTPWFVAKDVFVVLGLTWNGARTLALIPEAWRLVVKFTTKLKNQKSGRKAKAVAKDGEKRAPSGFAKPTLLSDELCEFLGQPKGTSLARTEVTRIINKYVKDQNLQDENDKRQINPDAKLKSILSTKGPDDKVTYFNLQSFIKHHFVKA